MAVMVTMTLKTDPATYEALHEQMLSLARAEGMLAHASREVDGQVAVVDIWPSPEAYDAFAQGSLAAGMQSAGIEMPDDVQITPLLHFEAAS